jgi:hypothetical protein
MRNLILAIVAAQAVNAQLTAEDLDQDMANALIVASSQQALTQSITETNSVYKTADQVTAAVTEMMTVANPVFAVLGFVSGAAKFFQANAQYKEILA